ncbi:MAG TPA: ATP-binding protein [Blastocatellia bacterium]|nr:ATP-binding protein [Blastocatellia bacterium]
MRYNLKEFLSEALRQPSDYVTYFAGAKLVEMYPGATIIENESLSFDLAEYAEAGLCSIWAHEDVHCQKDTQWRGVKKGLKREIENGWFSVLWPDGGKDFSIDVVYLTWNDGGCETTRHWIIAETCEVAENFMRAVCAYCDEVHSEILVYEDGYWSKDDKLFTSIKSATFDNLILPPQLMRELREDFQRFFASREVYQNYGIPWKRGALFIGPPGNGKTHAIKALVNELNLPCLYVKSFKAEHVTEQSNMRRVFTRARRNAPCLVVLEDLDALIEDQNRAFLLNELDGFADNDGVVVLASTNHPEKLDQAILDRPSRFDRKYHFTLPGLPERIEYVQHWNRTLQPEMRLTDSESMAIAECVDGFSFAFLKELFLSAMMQWISAKVSCQEAGQATGGMCEALIERASLLRKQLSDSKRE